MFYKIRVNSWDNAVAVFQLISQKTPLWIFRGQSDSSWPLETKFEREGKKHDLDPYWYNLCEANIIRGFQRQANQYIQNLPKKKSFIDWLGLIQHYGGPTRLLDFTYSFYVAAFFANQHSISESAIWSINANYILKQNAKIKPKLGKVTYSKLIDIYVKYANKNIKSGKIFNECDKEKNIFIVEPFNQEQRLGIQQGLFLLPTDIEASFQSNLCKGIKIKKDNISNNGLTSITLDELKKVEGDELCIVKILFSKDMHYESVHQLSHMNINDRTLFPGIDGFARSLSSSFDEIKWSITKPTS